jgi:hypothetical protein
MPTITITHAEARKTVDGSAKRLHEIAAFE